jgi:hypothetical protein
VLKVLWQLLFICKFASATATATATATASNVWFTPSTTVGIFNQFKLN